jgi:flagellar basal-body rod protein FlgF
LATGIWTSASGGAAQAQNLDVIASNLANSDTPSYKKDIPTFKEYLSTVERQHDAADIPRGAIKDKDFYPLDGRDQSMVVMDGTHTNFQQGSLRVTQRQLDVALDGPGFLEVATPLGVRYTRDGSLKTMADGRLVTSDGFPVLGIPLPGTLQGLPQNPAAQAGTPQGAINSLGPDVVARFINLKDKGTHFTFAPGGEVYSDDNLIAKLNIVEFQDVKKVRKTGGQLFINPDPANISANGLTNAPVNAQGTTSRTIIRQGVLETSNVNPIEEMTNMIKANRNFEQDMKALKTYGEIMGREVNDIGKL